MDLLRFARQLGRGRGRGGLEAGHLAVLEAAAPAGARGLRPRLAAAPAPWRLGARLLASGAGRGGCGGRGARGV